MKENVPPAEVPAREYRLFVRKGIARFYLKNNDEGIWLSERGIGWFIGGVSCTQEWRDLALVHLQVGHVPKHGAIGNCALHFNGGEKLTVLSASKWGGVDAERNAEYVRFLADFHRAVPDTMRDKIGFQSGVGAFQHKALIVTLVIAACFFVLMPLGLLIYTGKLEALFILGAGAAFMWPMFRMIKVSEPNRYDSRQVPEDLFP